MVSYLGHLRFCKRGTSWVGQPGPLSPCVAGNMSEVEFFEVDALAIKSLMSGTYITIKKANCQALTLQ